VVAVSALIALAYASSFGGAFQFDDLPAIVENPTIRHLATALRPPVGGLTVSGRPLLNLTFALNYAVSGERVWSYHLLNLAIHLGCALFLLGIVRRTLVKVGSRWANGTALTVALLWGVHPLTTESVTYIVQRAESLSGLFFLGSFYGFVRLIEPQERHPGRWALWSWGSCLLAIMAKEVAVTAPVVILLYDRTFVAGGWRELWRKRQAYYGAMASTWGVLLILVGANGWDRGGTSGLGVGVAWLPYWISQGEAVARYGLLSVWPHPLAFDYGPPSAPYGLALALFLALVAGLALTFLGCVRGRPWAFLAGSALLILSPTSVLPGVLQFASEHRMYLPLGAVVAGAVVCVAGRLARLPDSRSQRLAVGRLLAVPAIGYGAATFVRNRIYADDLDLWSQTVERRPASPTAQANLGQALLNRGRLVEAVPHCERAVELNPALPTARYNLGLAYENLERWPEALAEFEFACSLNPKLFYAQYHAGRLLDRLNQPAAAEKHLLAALREEPNLQEAHASLGVAEAALGHDDEAIREYGKALAADPKQPEVEYNLAQVLARQGRLSEASDHYQKAVALKAHYWEAELNGGIALAQLEQMVAAERSLAGAVRDRPASAEAHANLGIVLDQEGRHAEAVSEYRAALRLKPDYAEAHYNLGNALIAERNLRAARFEFAEAVRVRPRFSAAREMLARIDAVLGAAP
jgi:tetratricopeptide (TPR) repeat protein